MKILKSILISGTLTFLSPSLQAKNFTSAEVAAQSMNMDCVNYCVIGVCYYLICTPTGCSINTTARISHYLPDLFVTVYDEPKENPWTEYREVMGNAEEAAEKGIIAEITGTGLSGGEFSPPEAQADSSIKYKDVSVVGHPLALVTKKQIAQFVCPTDVTPYMPYFSSTFDYVGWRWGIPDMFTAAALIPGKREIGSKTTTNVLGNSWGSVYPRTGKLLQYDDAKTAAVIAQRAVDIVTRTGQSHIYRPIKGSSSLKFDSNQFKSGQSNNDSENVNSKMKGPLFSDQSDSKGSGPKSNSEKSSQGASNEQTDHWQMFSPKTDSKCKPFGTSDASWTKGRTNEKHQYAWNYWRKYVCCIPGTGVYIGHTDITPVCTGQN